MFSTDQSCMTPTPSVTAALTDSQTFAHKLRDALHQGNIYKGFDPCGREPTDRATNRDVFLPIIEKLAPILAVEVGAWKGGTSVVFAEAMRKANPEACLVCVDTWLGSIEHINQPKTEWDLRPMMEHGFPRLYEYWMTTVLDAGVEDVVVPLANTSTTAAKWIARNSLNPGFVFLDAGHDEDDVIADLNAWWPLLADGGVMAGDDWSSDWPGVEKAVSAHCIREGLRVQVSGPNWIIQKPGG